MSLSQYIPKSEDSFLSVVPNIFFNVLRQQVLMSFLICFFHNMNKRHLHPKKSFFHPLLESFFTNKLVCNFCNFSYIISHLFFSQKFYTGHIKRNLQIYYRLGGLVPTILFAVNCFPATREFDTLKSKKVPQSLEIGLFFCQIFIFII